VSRAAIEGPFESVPEWKQRLSEGGYLGAVAREEP
jgi:hypothetical protein